MAELTLDELWQWVAYFELQNKGKMNHLPADELGKSLMAIGQQHGVNR